MKKGLLLSNALSVVIAILGLILIGVLMFKLNNRFTIDKENESAKIIVNNIKARIDLLEVGQAANFSIRGVNSRNTWYLTAWGKNQFPKPDKCFFNSCICVCKSDPFDYLDKQEVSNNCQSIGLCREIAVDAITVINYELEGIPNDVESTLAIPPHAFIDEQEGKINLPSNFITLQVEKMRDEQNKISLTITSRSWL